MLIMIIYIIIIFLSYRFFSKYIVEERDTESVSILIIMSVGWPIVYIVFLILAIRKLWRKFYGKMSRM